MKVLILVNSLNSLELVNFLQYVSIITRNQDLIPESFLMIVMLSLDDFKNKESRFIEGYSIQEQIELKRLVRETDYARLRKILNRIPIEIAKTNDKAFAEKFEKMFMAVYFGI